MNLKPDDEIVLTIAEHSSNLLPWTRAARQAGAKVRVVDVDDDGRPRLDQFRGLLSKRTRIVAFTHVSNVLGYINPASEMCALARQAGARVVIDGAQGAVRASAYVYSTRGDIDRLADALREIVK
jgi:cysteine desulfurase/selenocysteine lyase